MLAVVLLALAAAPTPLTSAREHLAQGKLDDVLFDLDGKALDDADKPAAAELLAKAGDAALGKGDAVMSLQFAQMALRLEGDEVLALEVGARAARAQQQYGPAEEYADKWIATTRNARAHLLRAELATDQGDWQQGLDQTKGIRERDLSDAERARLKLVRETCQKELHERKAGSAETKALEAKLEAAAEKAKRMPDHPASRSTATAAEPAGNAAVILYGASGSVPTRQARQYLRSRKVAFVEKDIQKDAAAVQELGPKLAAQHVTSPVLPIIDCRGTLVVGFNRAELDRLLQGL
jgi:hypothetical protein